MLKLKNNIRPNQKLVEHAVFLKFAIEIRVWSVSKAKLKNFFCAKRF